MRYRCAGCGTAFEGEDARCPACHRKTTVSAVGSKPPPVLLAGPRLAAEPTAAQKHWKANAILQTAFIALHFLSLGSVAVNFALMSMGGPLGGAFAPPQDAAEAAGFYGTLGVIGGWSLIGLVWTPINAWGLWKKRPWARTSTLVYWIGSLFTCCCVPFGAYGIWSLLREDVRAFSRPDATERSDS